MPPAAQAGHVGEQGGGVGAPLQDLLPHLKFQDSRHTLGPVRLSLDAFCCVHTFPRCPHPPTQPLGTRIFCFQLKIDQIYSISVPVS